MAEVLRKYAYLSNTERSYLLQIYLNIKRICNKKKQHNTRKEKKRHGVSKFEQRRNHWHRCFLCADVLLCWPVDLLHIYCVCNGRKIIIISARSRITRDLNGMAELASVRCWLWWWRWWWISALQTDRFRLIRSSMRRYPIHPHGLMRWWRFTF